MKTKILSIILLLAVLVVPLMACNVGGDGNGTTANPNNPSGSIIPDNYTAIVRDNASAYTIVYPSSAGDVVKAQAERLAAEIEAVTGVEIPVEDDRVGGTNGSEYEIRVGRVSRLNALSVYDGYSKFGDRDYAIKQVDGYVYVYGDTAQAVVAAMEYFLNKVISLKHDFVGVETGYSQSYVEGQVEAISLGDIEEKYVHFSADAGTIAEFHLRLSYTGNKGWRIQSKNSVSDYYQDMGASQRLSISLGETPKLDVYPLTVTNENGIVTVTVTNDESAGKAVVNLNDFKMDFYSASGALSATIDNITSNMGGSSITGTYLDEKEAVFGTGERFNAVNQRGKKIHMFSKDIWSQDNACYMVVPMLCFSRGSGIFLNIYEEMNLNLGYGNKNNWNASIIGAKLDCYVFTTEQMEDSIYGYTELSGHAGEVEEWTYGMLICRYGPDLSQKWTTDVAERTTDGDYRRMGVYDCIALMEEHDLPWTGILAESWGPNNSKKHADLEELCDYVHSLGKKFLVYMRVGWAGAEQSGFKADYLLEMVYPNGTTTTKLPASETNNPDTAGSNAREYPYLDITNPEAVEWFFGEYWDYLSNDVGVDGCKIDFCETLPEYYTLDYFNSEMPTSGSHHWYPSAFCAMYWEMISSKPDGGMCYTRGGGIGAQRAPYMWAGDQARRYSSIGWQLTACLSSGMSGVPFMSYDMSGYQYGSNYDNINVRDPQFEAQVFVRGLQYSAFTICMQQHGKVRNAFDFTVGEIKMVRVRKDSGKYTTSGLNADTWNHWTAVTTGSFNASTGYYTGINPVTGELYEWVRNEDGSIKTVNVYVIDPTAKEKTYTLDSCKKDKDGNVIESYTYIRNVKVTDGTFDTKTGYYKGYNVTTGGLESDGIRYVYTIQPGSMTYVTDIYRGYVKLHDHLAPYLSELTAEASATGMPVMRILTLGRQDDENTYNIKDEYMFGEAFLVAPVLNEAYARNIYLPEGRWKDLNTGDVYEVSGGVCLKNGEELAPDQTAPDTNGKGFWLMGYGATLAQLPVFYDLDCESETARGLLPGIQEIFRELNTIALPVA